MRSFPARLALLALSALAAAPAFASTVTSMTTEILVRQSPVIVLGQVESLTATSDAQGNPQTWVTLRVDESLKGAAGRARIAVSLPGGRVGDYTTQVYGTPRFRTGERVLVFATPTKAGLLTVTGLFQGKFSVESANGAEQAVQDAGEGALLVGRGTRPTRQALAPFLKGLRKRIGAGAASTLPASITADAPPGAATDTSFTLLPLIPFRYFEPDTGGAVSFLFNPAGSPLSAAASQAGFTASRNNWTNVTGSTVVVNDGGPTTQSCRTLFDGSVISHGDPCLQMPAFDATTCSGVLAITGVSGFTLESKLVNGVSFLRMTESDTVFNANAECFYSGPDAQANYEEVLSHEMGHALGLGHACGDSFTPECVPGTEEDDALMAAFAHGGRGGAPHASDVDGIRFIYPPAGFVDLQVDRTAIAAGQSQSVKVDLNGTASADFYLVLVLPGGGFISIAPGATPNVLKPVATNVALHFLTDVPLLTKVWSAAEAGSYSWYAILTRAGTSPSNTANWIGVDAVPFSVGP